MFATSATAATTAASHVPGGDILVPGWAWLAVLIIIISLVTIDLLMHRDNHEVSFREAVVSSLVWIGIAVGFTFVIWAGLGADAAGQYLAGWLIEESLSVDNVFVWAVILQYFAVPKNLQRRVLFWGIFGALVLRFIFIAGGIALLNRLEWLELVFGAILVFTAWRMVGHANEEIHPENNPVLKLMRRMIPVTADFEGQHFFVRRAGRLFATPLFVVLVMVETSDVVFAVDSIPAILAISRSTFIVFTSNAFAILGLRSLYFVLLGAADRLVHLNLGLGVILAFVGIKMMVGPWLHMNTWLSLVIVATILAITVFSSLRATRKTDAAASAGEKEG